MASNKKDLNAYVRFDGTGRIIPGSLILQRNKPKVGNWKQTTAYECCDPNCTAPVYDNDYIIIGIEPYGVDQAVITILVAPGTSVEAGLVDCNGNLMVASGPLAPVPAENTWIVTVEQLFTSCDIQFRRVCFDGEGYSSWRKVPPLG